MRIQDTVMASHSQVRKTVVYKYISLECVSFHIY